MLLLRSLSFVRWLISARASLKRERERCAPMTTDKECSVFNSGWREVKKNEGMQRASEEFCSEGRKNESLGAFGRSKGGRAAIFLLAFFPTTDDDRVTNHLKLEMSVIWLAVSALVVVVVCCPPAFLSSSLRERERETWKTTLVPLLRLEWVSEWVR